MLIVFTGTREKKVEDHGIDIINQAADEALGYMAYEEVSKVWSGGARGVDFLAVRWCEYYLLDYDIEQADWGLYGNKAGPIRNGKMLDLARLHSIDTGLELICIGIPGPSSRGTWDCITQAKDKGIRTHVWKGLLNR